MRVVRLMTDDRHGDELVLYRCTECGKLSVSVGWLHAHIEAKHTGFGPFNIVPDIRAIGNYQNDMTMTKVLRVDEATEIGIEDVEHLR